MANKSGDLTKIDGMGNGVTTNDLQRQAIKDALAEELADKQALRDEALAMIDEDERKLAELERLVKKSEAVEYKPIRASELTVSIDADVDEAVTGLKRLQRELRETTKAVREVGGAYKGLNSAVEAF